MASKHEDMEDQRLLTTSVGNQKLSFHDFDQALNLSGGFGTFQLFALTILILAHISGGMMVYGLGFLLKQPNYDCLTDSGHWEACTP